MSPLKNKKNQGFLLRRTFGENNSWITTTVSALKELNLKNRVKKMNLESDIDISCY